MKKFSLCATVFATLLAAWVALAQEDAPTPKKLPPLEGVQWAGPTPSLAALHGKTVLLMVYATWCPICNGWSGEFFAQLKEAIADKPVVVLAVNADESSRGVQQYLTERAFFAPNICHGHDPTFHKQLGFKSNLYNYVLINAKGKPVSSGFAGSFFPAPEGKKFALPAELAESKTAGRFKIMKPDMSAEIKALLWPVELGQATEASLLKGRSRLAAEQRQELDAVIGRWADGRLAEVKGLYKGSVGERLQAYELSAELAANFKTTAQGKKARDVVSYLEKDEEFKREVAAKKAYDAALEKAGGNAKRRATGLRNVAKRFEGTHYAQLAEQRIGKQGGEK